MEKIIYGVQEEAINRYALLRVLFEATIVAKPLFFFLVVRHTTEKPINIGFINNSVNSVFKVCLFITYMKKRNMVYTYSLLL